MEKLTVKCYRGNAIVFGEDKNLNISFEWVQEFTTDEAMAEIEQDVKTAFPDACHDSLADVLQTICIHISPFTL